MTLPAAAPRRLTHTRAITCEGFEREDGLWDIEVHLIDTKTHAVDEPYRGLRPAGSHTHEMRLRLTLDTEKKVHDIAVSSVHAPYDACFTVEAAYKRLRGANVGAGWRKAVNEAVGGIKGCTHLREMLLPAATVAYQAMSKKWIKDPQVGDVAKPYYIDACKAWSAEGPVVRYLFPMHYRAKPDAGA